MGTYGITHIKKDETIIALSDSYDGYMANGMGQSNLICIKYLSTPLLKKLFDEFTASEKVPVKKTKKYHDNDDDDEQEINQRMIEQAVYTLKKDSDNQEVHDWVDGSLNDEIRLSSVGFAPVLAVNVNPHYGRDYDHCDYMIDLDQELFIYDDLKISFEKIRSGTIFNIQAFCSDETAFLPANLQKFSKELFRDDYTPKEQKIRDEIVNAYLSIDNNILLTHYKKLEEEQKAAMLIWEQEQHTINHQDEDNIAQAPEENYGGFSVHTAQINGSTLKTIITLICKLNREFPETCFLKQQIDWSINNEHTEGSIRIFSTRSNGNQNSEIVRKFIDLLQTNYQVLFNILSSTGTWTNTKETDDNTNNSNDIFGLFTGKISGPEESLFSLEEIKHFEHQELIFEGLDLCLTVNADYNEVRSYLLNPNQNITSPIIWCFMSILNQDIEAFNCIYPISKKTMKTLDGDTFQQVCIMFLENLADSLKINTIIADFSNFLHKPLPQDNSENFINNLKLTNFFGDVLPFMNDFEKEKYNIVQLVTTNPNKKMKN